ncbi:MAG: hypothetical protein ABW123_27775 [Cystobacter sp.]
MRRVIQQLLLGLLVFGLIAPISASSNTRKLTVRANSENAEETSESLDESFTLSRLLARLARARVAPPRPRANSTGGRASQPPRVSPPEQVLTPRAVVVWRPSNPVPDEDPPQA